MKRLSVPACLVLIVLMTGCASSSVGPRSMVQRWPYGQFKGGGVTAAPDVQTCLNLGDKYRDLAYSCSFPVLVPTPAYWYAEESKKFYNYVWRDLEPQNAYAAVSVGFVSMMQARVAGSKKEREAALDTAYANLMEADRRRKGFKDAHVYLGELHAMRRDWDKAIREFSMLTASEIEDSYIHAWWGYSLKGKGNSAEAALHFRKAVELGYPEQSASWARSQLR